VTHPAPGSPARTIKLMHFAMFFGVFLLGVVAVVVNMRPDAPDPVQPPVMGIVFTGIGALSMAISLAVFRPRFPGKSSGESSDAFWTQSRMASALIIWALIEGGALVGVVGYFLTRIWAPLTLAIIAVLLGFVTRPAALEGN
jgi:hypothetical protein